MALLDVHNLTVRFGGLTAVNHVDLKIEQGKIVSVIGPNGAGKTTVFNTITGIYEPTEGSITLDGQTLALPLRWHNVVLWVVMGLVTGVLFLLFGMNIDKVWAAAIHEDHVDWSGAWAYLHGDLTLRQARSLRAN